MEAVDPQGKQSLFLTSSVPIPLFYKLSLYYIENDKNIKQYPCGVLRLQKYLTHTKSIPALDQPPTVIINYSASVSWECISILTPNNHFIMNLVITLLVSKSKQTYLVMKFRLPSLKWNKYGRTINYSADREVWQVILGTHSGKLDCTSWEPISASEWVASMYGNIFLGLEVHINNW